MTEPSDRDTDREPDGDGTGAPSGKDTAEPPDAPPAAASPPETSSRGLTVALVTACLLLVVALITYILVSQKASDRPSAVSTTTPTRPDTSPTTTLPPELLTIYDDPRYGFTISYPQSWERIDIPEGNRRLVIAEVGLNGASVSVLGTVDEPDLLEFARNSIAGPDLDILVEQEVSIAGAVGFYFVYTFSVEGADQPAYHAHYFLVRAGGNEMLTLVFQAANLGEFRRLASTFDQILESLTLRAAPTPTTTTTTTTP